MKSIAKEMGANDTGLNLMDKVIEFETQLANVSIPFKLIYPKKDYFFFYFNLCQVFYDKKELIL